MASAKLYHDHDGTLHRLQDIPAEQVRFIETRTLAGVRAKA